MIEFMFAAIVLSMHVLITNTIPNKVFILAIFILANGSGLALR